MNRRVITAVVGAFALGLTASPAAAEQTDYSETLATLDREIPELMAEAGTVGLALAIVDGQRIVTTKGYGFADRQAGTPVTPGTLFHIGSVSKTFSAITVMQLVEQGRVDLDAPLSRYVPKFSLLPRYQHNKITVRTVLDHHSGIPGDVFNGLITDRTPDPGFRAWMRKALRKMYPERRVNTLMAYNNSGFVLLQDLVENVTGEDFEQYTREKLFTPMGMPNSTFNDTVAPDSALTRNYMWRSEGDVRQRPREYVNGWTAGSILSSADEMANYLRMLNARGQGVAGKVIEASTLERMLTAQTDLPLDIIQIDFGLSWILYPQNWAGFMYGHDGGTLYNFTKLYVLPGSGLAVFASVNTGTPGNLVDEVALRALSLAYTAKTGIAEPATKALPTKPADPPSAAYVRKQAGVWAGGNSYALVRANGPKLTVIGQDTLTYQRMRGGWWASKKRPEIQIRLRTIEGRRIMVSRSPSPSGITHSVVSQKASTPKIPNAWRQRFGAYRATNKVKSAPAGLAPARLRLRERDGVMIMVRPPIGIEVLQPIKSGVAYSFGMWPGLGRGKGDGLIVKGGKLVYMGIVYAPVA